MAETEPQSEALIEKVARDAYEAWVHIRDVNLPHWYQLPERDKNIWRLTQRAALDASGLRQESADSWPEALVEQCVDAWVHSPSDDIAEGIRRVLDASGLREAQQQRDASRKQRDDLDEYSECLAVRYDALVAERDALQRRNAELVEAASALEFGVYPAHGSGFATIVIKGNIDKLRAALARARGGQRCDLCCSTGCAFGYEYSECPPRLERVSRARGETR